MYAPPPLWKKEKKKYTTEYSVSYTDSSGVEAHSFWLLIHVNRQLNYITLRIKENLNKCRY